MSTPTKAPLAGDLAPAGEQNAVEPVANQKSLGFYNRLFLVPKPNNRWRPILDLSTLNTFLNTRVVQNGDTRDNKNLPTGRGVGYLHRFQGRILPHTNSQSVQEVHAFSRQGTVLPQFKAQTFGLVKNPWSSQWWPKRSN